MTHTKSVAIVGAGIFGLSLAVALKERGMSFARLHTSLELIAGDFAVTIFDKNEYDRSWYQTDLNADQGQAASVDENKIFRASYGKKLHYQKLAMESREAWQHINEEVAEELFVGCGMLRVQPNDELGALEKETLANMERANLRGTQFVASDPIDRARAVEMGWAPKLLAFEMPDSSPTKTFEAVLDSTAGFTYCSNACVHFLRRAIALGVSVVFGGQQGTFESLVEEDSSHSPFKRAVGLKTKDGKVHNADIVVIAAGSFSTQVLPTLSYHLESSAGSIAKFKVHHSQTELWNKFAPENFPVITWKSAKRDQQGKDVGSVYAFPRTPEGIIKIGYRGIKFTNFEPAPQRSQFTQEGKWSVPLPADQSQRIPDAAEEAVRQFVSIFLSDLKDAPFYSTKLCWYTDTLDNSFVIDYVPTYASNSVFVCTGGSGHGAKFLPVLGQHAADILEYGERSSSYMREHWQWRDQLPRRNGLEEGPNGRRDLSRFWKENNQAQ